MFNKLREPVSGLTHLGAAIIAAGGLAVMVYIGRDSVTKTISLVVYGVSLVLMFAASAAYHLIKSSPPVTKLLRKLDHSAIYLLIAGTYTPICLYFFSGFWRWGLLGIIWVMAASGIAIKIFFINPRRWLTTAIYLLMGWLSIMAINEIISNMPTPALIWLVLGGLFFTLGAVVYIIRKPNFYPGVFGFHEVWHIFVILGCLCHFIVIAAFVAPGVLAA
jgi:hemolysin III